MDTQTTQQPPSDLTAVPHTVVEVIRDPVNFYRTMPRTGGFLEPLIFAVILGFAAALVQFLLGGLFGLGTAVTLSLLFLWPILIAIFSFVGAGILYGIWVVMGSQYSYETAYRCTAYAAAIYPVLAVLGIIPYLGTIIGTAWAAYLLIVASIEVHGIKPNTAYLIFGGLGLLLLLSSLSAEYGGRRLASEVERFGGKMEGIEEMTPEEAGRVVGEFLKGLEKAGKDKEAGN
jgi:hypothetical protein